MSKATELSAKLREGLEHLQRARSQGMTLVDYSGSIGIKVSSLYDARRRLAQRGLWPEEAIRSLPQKSAEFVAVKITAPPSCAAGVVCRLCHPSGWVIDCMSWPHSTWVNGLFDGDVHATP